MRIGAIFRLLVVLTGGVVVAAVMVLLTVDFGAYKSEITAALTDATGRELTVDGDFKLRFGIRPSVTAAGVKLANAPWGSRPHMMTAARFEAEIALLPLLKGRVEVRRLIFVEPKLFIETNKQGRSNWAIDVGEIDDNTTIPDIDTVVIRDGIATIVDGVTRERRTVELSSLRLERAGVFGSFDFFIDGALDDRRLRAKGKLGIPAKGKGGESPWLLDFTAEAGGAEFTVIGSVKSPVIGKGVDLDVTAKGRNLSRLAAWVGMRTPRMGPYSFGGRITDAGTRWRISRLRARIGRSDANGSVNVALRRNRVFLRAVFASSRIDLDEMGLTHPSEESHRHSPRRDAKPVHRIGHFEALRGVDASVKFNARRVRAAGIGLTNVSLNLSVSDGVAVLRPFKAGIGGGVATADVTLDATGTAPVLALVLRTKKVDVAELTSLVGAGDMLAGAVDVDLDLESRGTTLSELAAGLNGSFTAVMGHGKLRNEYFDRLSTDVIRSISPWASPRREARINCAVARYDIKNGIAMSRATVIDSDRATVVGDGAIDLGREKIDFTASPSVKDAGLVSLTVPIRISGALDDPSITLDSGKLAKDTVGAVADIAESIASLVGIGDSSDDSHNPCVAALAASIKRHSRIRTPPEERPWRAAEIAPAGPGEGEASQGIGSRIAQGLIGLFRE